MDDRATYYRLTRQALEPYLNELADVASEAIYRHAERDYLRLPAAAAPQAELPTAPVPRPKDLVDWTSELLEAQERTTAVLPAVDPTAVIEPAWDPRRLHTLEARMESWTRRRHRSGIRLS